VHFYLRNLNATQCSWRSAGRSQDTFLGVTRIAPRFDKAQKEAEDAAEFNQKVKTLCHCGAEWLDVQCGTGKIHIKVEYVEKLQPPKIETFELLKVLGKGSFGKVLKIKKIDTQRLYALKTLRKAHIICPSEDTLPDRFVLSQINNLFIVPLKFTFQSPEKVYIISAFVQGGGLFDHLQREPLKRFE
jgi:serum/glucocorticoid-regulated kinase 2